MSGAAEWSLQRARRELAAARHLVDGGFTAQAVSRAYYAAFYAAEACLAAIGETRSKHAGVIAAIVEHVVRPGGFDPEIARLLRRLFDERNEADYAAPEVSVAVADEAVADAARFVGEAERWLAGG